MVSCHKSQPFLSLMPDNPRCRNCALYRLEFECRESCNFGRIPDNQTESVTP